MPPVGFELTISAGERPQTKALDRAVTGTGGHCQYQMEHMNTVWEKFRLELLKYYTH